MSKIRLWFVIPVCILMVGFMFGSAWTDFHEVEDFKQNGVKTFGIITKQDFAGRSGENIYVDYEYIVGESIYEAYGEWITNDEFGESLEEGSLVEVYYLPSDASQSLVVGNGGNSRSLTYGGLIALVVAGLLIMPRPIPQRWRRKQIAKVIINVRWLIATSFVPFALAFILYFEPLEQRPFNLMAILVIGTPILIAVYLFLYFVSRLRRERHSVQGAIARQYVDVSSEELLPPKGNYDLEHHLKALNFHRLGEIAREFPVQDKKMIGWLYHNEDYTIIVEVVYVLEMLRFYSWFGDGFITETLFPHGENLNIRKLASRFTEESVAKAYQIHLANYQDHVIQHGLPHSIKTIDDALRWDRIYMPMFFRRKMRRSNTTEVLRVIFGVYLVAFTVGFIPAYKSFSKEALWVYVTIGMAFVFILNMLPLWFFNHGRTPIHFAVAEAKQIHQENQM